ncbi:hypothetical protein [Methylobacterium sp. PvR107]|uniref:hypothetical protein n=1 Tax=Methylobacterium sp. PvR107 TaxID=2806597 RepID=UPI001B4F7999|nr:hypothetical protein [Methylobacterium sp. PvR107]MBP1181511.1 two-component sensor histidine kinase [Methylobacterium sp. PvR107]
MSDLAGLIGATLRPDRDNVPTVIEGPLVAIHGRHVSSPARMLHEWATNAVKYGALGSDAGSLSVTWNRDAEALTLVWRERMARVAEPRPGHGFGSLLSGMCLWQLEANVERRHGATEDRITLTVPDAALTRG